jgi:hypothetical protein
MVGQYDVDEDDINTPAGSATVEPVDQLEAISPRYG